MDMHESLLFRRLEATEAGLSSRLTETWDVAERLLRTIAATHPGFTSHGPDHSAAVLKNLDDAVRPLPELLDGLSKIELYLLVCAALVHDIGMVGPVITVEAERERIRRGHHIRSMQFIRTRGAELSIPRDLQAAVAKVAGAHRGAQIQDTLPASVLVRGHEIRLRLCAALVRLADECHVAHDRVPHDYSMLSLPEESETHFRTHLLLSGPLFDAPAGQIRFSAELYTDEDETWVSRRMERIEGELALLVPIFGTYGIPYETVCCEEDRTELAQRRVLRELLRAGALSCAELTLSTGETPESINSTMKMVGDSPPFECVERAGKEFYSVEASESTFLEVANSFLHEPEHPNDQVLFLQSELAQSVLTDLWLKSRFLGFLTDPGSARLTWRILRTSPEALRHALKSLADDTPATPITGGGGFLTTLVGSLQNDFLRFPSLLLEPGLVDDIHSSGLIDEETWKRLRIKQIAVYHEAYEDAAVLEQWVMPSEWELRAERTEAVPRYELNVSFRGKEDQIGNPLLQLAAARRLDLPLRLSSTPSVAITVQSDAGPEPLQAGRSVHAIVVGAPETTPIMTGVVPAHFEEEEGGSTYSLVAPLDVTRSEFDWTQPIRCHIRLLPPTTDEQGRAVRPVTSTLNLLFDNLDSGQAALMLKMAESTTGATIRFPWMADRVIDSPATTDQLRAFLNLAESMQERAFTAQLGKMQQLLRERIPVPLYKLTEELIDMVVRTAVSDETDARRLWDQLMGRLAEIGKPTVSPFIVEIYQDEVLRDRHYLDAVFGVHMPRLRIATDTGRWIGTTGDELDRSLDDPSQHAAWIRAMQIRLSPQAAVEVLRCKPRDLDGEEHVNVTALKEFVAHEPVEARTEVSVHWESAYETPWASVTPFVVRLRAFLPQERWFLENQHFTKTATDARRAYVSAKEAFRIAPDDIDLRVNMGWSAFQAGRIKEALDITEPVTRAGEQADSCVASANVGLFHLRLAKAASDPASHIAAANEAYERVKELLASLEQDQAERIRSDVLGDLRLWSDSLHDEAAALMVQLSPEG